MRYVFAAAATTAALTLAAGFVSRSNAQAAPPESTFFDPDVVVITIQAQDNHAEVLKALSQSQKDLEKASKELRERRYAAPLVPGDGRGANVFTQAFTGFPSLPGFPAGQDVRIDVDMDGVPTKDALKKIFADAKQPYEIISAIPAGTTVSLKARKIRLSYALQIIADQADISWSQVYFRVKDTDTITMKYRVAGPQSSAGYFNGATVKLPGAYAGYTTRFPYSVNDINVPNAGNTSFSLTRVELRQHFKCPHCGNKVTIVKSQAEKSRNTWRFCPSCGKPVDMEDEDDTPAPPAAIATGRTRIRLEPGFQVRIVVQAPDEKKSSCVYDINSEGYIKMKTYPIVMQVSGYTLSQLQNELTVKLRPYIREPKVTTAIVSNK